MKKKILEIATSVTVASLAILALTAWLSSFIPPSKAYIPVAEVIIKNFNP